MKKACAWSVLVVKALAADGTSALKKPEQVSVTVRVYNYAAVPGEYLRRATAEVSRILAMTGINTRFTDCPLSPAFVDRYSGCESGGQSTEVALRLRSGLPRRELVRSSAVFGYAFLSSDGVPGTLADVYVRGAAVLAEGRKTLEPVMLGTLMAHEIGHLLLGRGKHSAAGLMCAPWGRLEMERAAQGCLRFLEAEGKKMRANCRTNSGRRDQVAQAPPPLSGQD